MPEKEKKVDSGCCRQLTSGPLGRKRGNRSMKSHYFKAPAIMTAVALALAGGMAAQTPTPIAKGMTGHQHPAGTASGHEASGKKVECEAMMAKKQAMQDKLQAMDATLDKLVAEMNAAKESKAADALEKPMAAVLNELVTQRKAMHSMMTEMQPAMMAHMTRHMQMGSKKGAMQPMADCPMMKMSEHETKH